MTDAKRLREMAALHREDAARGRRALERYLAEGNQTDAARAPAAIEAAESWAATLDAGAAALEREARAREAEPLAVAVRPLRDGQFLAFATDEIDATAETPDKARAQFAARLRATAQRLEAGNRPGDFIRTMAGDPPDENGA
jgi:hypothetical protein